jgi:two-component system response regulator
VSSNKILVIDDSRVIRMRVREMLPKGNFEILEAKDGVEGLTLIHQERPNLIMLDFLLPRKSGWEVFQEIQSQPDLQHIPLVMMSGRKEEVTEKIPEPFEYFEFIQKPFEQKELVDAIKAAMAKARLPRATTSIADASSGDLGALRTRVETLEAEVSVLKKQLNQVLTYIRQKM